MQRNFPKTAFLVGAMVLVGCGQGGTENLSTRAVDDPDRHEQARAEAERLDQETRAAEERAIGTLHRKIEEH